MQMGVCLSTYGSLSACGSMSECLQDGEGIAKSLQDGEGGAKSFLWDSYKQQKQKKKNLISMGSNCVEHGDGDAVNSPMA